MDAGRTHGSWDPPKSDFPSFNFPNSIICRRISELKDSATFPLTSHCPLCSVLRYDWSRGPRCCVANYLILFVALSDQTDLEKHLLGTRREQITNIPNLN
jgi:hypothetical protein